MLPDVFDAFFFSETAGFSITTLLMTIFVPFFLGLPIAFVYRTTQKSHNYSDAIIYTIILFCCLSAVVTLLVGNNIARAFGLVGALSIVRFRNALKSPTDAIFIFWSLTVGLACGMQIYLGAAAIVGAVSTLVFGMQAFIKVFAYPETHVLRVFLNKDHGLNCRNSVEELFRKHKVKFSLLNVILPDTTSLDHSFQDESSVYVYQIQGGNQQYAKLQEELYQVQGVNKVFQANHINSVFAA